MTTLVSHALIHAGTHQAALARLCPMMMLVQDVIALDDGALVVLFVEPGMPATNDGFEAFRAAILGVAPTVTVHAVEGRFDDPPAARRCSLALLTQTLQMLTDAQPAAPVSMAGVPAFLVAYRGWRHAMGVVQAAVRNLDDRSPRLMVS